jgi:rhomboid protease GluP
MTHIAVAAQLEYTGSGGLTKERNKGRAISGARRETLIDLNHILLFIAIVSPLILLARIARLRNPRNRGWRIAAVIVLAVGGLSWWFVPSIAGFVGGTFWFLLLLFPSASERKIDDLLLARRLAGARRLAFVRRILHPWEDSPHRASLFHCLELASNGRLDLALDQLATEREAATPAGHFATALTFALTENWPGLVEWTRGDFTVTANRAVLPLYLRALGETGALDDLVLQLASRSTHQEQSLMIDSPSAFNLALALAFCGRTNDLVRLLAGEFRRMPPDHQQFWLATTELAEGNRSGARERLEKVRAETRDAVLQRSVDRRLGQAQQLAHLSASSEMLLARLVAEALGMRKDEARPRASATLAVWALILLNVAMFGVEWILGGTTNTQTLHNLGALEPDAVIVRHEYWRLFTALFLHYGKLHLLFNLYALYLLGPELERIIGSVKFTISYLIAGLGSSAGVVLLCALNLTNADLLVGASGCVMGVIGVSAGLLLRHRQTPLAGRRLRNIVVIVALQTAFDLWTPQVSLAAHLCGFITGVGVGAILAAQRRRLSPP